MQTTNASGAHHLEDDVLVVAGLLACKLEALRVLPRRFYQHSPSPTCTSHGAHSQLPSARAHGTIPKHHSEKHYQLSAEGTANALPEMIETSEL